MTTEHLNNTGAPDRTLNKRSDRIAYAILVACALFVSFCSDASPLSNAFPNTDSSVFIYIGQHILQGQMPYRDIFDHKGPLLYLINAAAILISPRWGLWLMELAFTAVAALVTYATCRRFGGSAISLTATVIAYLMLCPFLNGGNYSEQFALPFIALSLLCFSSYFAKGRASNAELLAIGLCAGCVFLMKLNLLASFVVIGCALIVLYAARHEPKRVAATIALSLCGFLAVCIPVIAWVAAGGAFDAFIDDYFRFNSEYIAGALTPDGVGQSMLWLFGYPAFTLGAVSVCALCFCDGKERRGLWVSLLAAFAFAAYLLVATGNRYPYYLLFWPALLALPSAAAMQWVADRWGGGSAKGARAAALALLCAVCMLPGAIAGVVDISTYHLAEDSTSPDRQGGLADAVQRYSDAQDTIVCYGQQAWIFDVTGRDAATKYIFQPEQGRLWIKQQALLADIRSNHPKLVVVAQGEAADIDSNLDGLQGYTQVYSNDWYLLYRAD